MHVQYLISDPSLHFVLAIGLLCKLPNIYKQKQTKNIFLRRMGKAGNVIWIRRRPLIWIVLNHGSRT